jgi:hypothetical protein
LRKESAAHIEHTGTATVSQKAHCKANSLMMA